jgi:hypothetical protein
MPGGVSKYERLLIDALLLLPEPPATRRIEPGAGLFVGPREKIYQAVFDLGVLPAMRKNDLNGSELHVVFDDFSSLAEVARHVQSAEVSVADASELNPSVMYVLGLCHGLGRCPIVLTRRVSELPFNLGQLRNVEYETVGEGLYELRERLERVLRVFLLVARRNEREP